MKNEYVEQEEETPKQKWATRIVCLFLGFLVGYFFLWPFIFSFFGVK